MNLIDKFTDSIQKKGSIVSIQEGTKSASSTTLGAKVKYYKMPNKLRQQQKEPRTTHEQIQQLKKANVQITYLERDCSDYHFIEGVIICPEGALQETVLPEHESSVQLITGDDEFDDHARNTFGPWLEKDYPRKKYKDRVVAIHWQHAEERHRWSIHVLKRAIIEQDTLLFDGVIAVPVDYCLEMGVNVYIGSWIGHHKVHWGNWRAPIAHLEMLCEHPVLQDLNPQKVRAQLQSRLTLIEGSAGTEKQQKMVSSKCKNL